MHPYKNISTDRQDSVFFFLSFLILQIMPAHIVANRKQEDLPEHPGKLYYAHYMCRWCQNAHYNKWSFRESGFKKNCAALWEYTLTNPIKLKRSIGISFTAQKPCASTVATFSCWDGWYCTFVHVMKDTCYPFSSGTREAQTSPYHTCSK